MAGEVSSSSVPFSLCSLPSLPFPGLFPVLSWFPPGQFSAWFPLWVMTYTAMEGVGGANQGACAHACVCVQYVMLTGTRGCV